MTRLLRRHLGSATMLLAGIVFGVWATTVLQGFLAGVIVTSAFAEWANRSADVD